MWKNLWNKFKIYLVNLLSLQESKVSTIVLILFLVTGFTLYKFMLTNTINSGPVTIIVSLSGMILGFNGYSLNKNSKVENSVKDIVNELTQNNNESVG